MRTNPKFQKDSLFILNTYSLPFAVLAEKSLSFVLIFICVDNVSINNFHKTVSESYPDGTILGFKFEIIEHTVTILSKKLIASFEL